MAPQPLNHQQTTAEPRNSSHQRSTARKKTSSSLSLLFITNRAHPRRVWSITVRRPASSRGSHLRTTAAAAPETKNDETESKAAPETKRNSGFQEGKTVGAAPVLPTNGGEDEDKDRKKDQKEMEKEIQMISYRVLREDELPFIFRAAHGHRHHHSHDHNHRIENHEPHNHLLSTTASSNSEARRRLDNQIQNAMAYQREAAEATNRTRKRPSIVRFSSSTITREEEGVGVGKEGLGGGGVVRLKREIGGASDGGSDGDGRRKKFTRIRYRVKRSQLASERDGGGGNGHSVV